MNPITVDNFGTFTVAIIVFFIGVHINRRIPILRDYYIPEPVTGGLLAAMVTYLIFYFFDREITFNLEIRDTLLVYFFTGIGLNARFSDLIAGGKPLLVMLFLTLSYIVIQNLVGIGGASLMGFEAPIGVLVGSASLIGGHGTAIAWAPEIENMGVSNALEIGITCATLGLILASIIGGPIAHVLINRYQLKSDSSEVSGMGVRFNHEKDVTIDHTNLMSVLLVLHITIILGWLLNNVITSIGMKLPLFVTCLLMGIVLSNLVALILPKIYWPVRTRALAVVSDFSLSLFLTMSLMSMQLWSIASFAGPLVFILFLQVLAAVSFTVFILFPLMGKNYQAAVLSAGFGGFALGATPTAIANMTAVTKVHGPAPLAFIILPLVAAFFVDIANSLLIRFMITL